MDRDKKIVKVSIVGIVVNMILVGMKMLVGISSSSIAIILDAVNNLSDALSSIITIIGTKLAGKAPDKKHPYGYGRIEYISSVTIAVFILAAGVTSLKESVEKIFDTEKASYSAVSLALIAVAVVMKFLLGRYVKREGEKYHSEALIASGTEGTLDSVVSLSTLVAAGINVLWGVSIEGILGTTISVIILKAGIEILLDSLSSIIGLRVESQLSKELKAYICEENPEVIGAYDLVLHRYGPERMIGSVHVELADDMTAKDIHALTRHITEGVHEKYGIVLTVGVYASNTQDGGSRQMKAALSERIKNYPEILQMHGFYVDEEKKLVSFDLVIDFAAKQKIELRDEILRQMKEQFGQYDFVAILDRDYSD